MTLRHVVLLCLLWSSAAFAKPLIYCTDSSPEGFDPGLWDTFGTNNINR